MIFRGENIFAYKRKVENNYEILLLNEILVKYRIEQIFGGEKTLANLANRHNSPSFFANIPNEARGHAVCVVNVRHVKQST